MNSLELDVKNLGKSFAPGLFAVDDVSFTVPPGEIAILLGPSGCGKTTTLRMVAGLDQPTAGAITLGKRLFSRAEESVFLPPQRRNLAMVFQSYAIWPHMSVAQNIAYPLRQRGVSGAELRRKVDEALAIVDLTGLGHRPSSALSGGQMQRVALARSIAYEPDLLLLDEPMSNLDPELRVRLRNDLRRLMAKTSVTVLYVTHDQAEAAALGDWIGVMGRGKLLQFARTQTLFSRPAVPAVARFTGATNQLEASIERAEGAKVIARTRAGSRFEATPIDPLVSGDPSLLLFRPENIRLRPSQGGDSTGLSGRVEDRQFLGGQTLYTLDIGGERIEALDAGTQTLWNISDIAAIELDAAACWAYRPPA